MTEQKDGIIIHFFSGYHIGAEMLLPPGKHVFGADDSADFILMDKRIAAHHFMLEVTQDPEKIDTISLAEEKQKTSKTYTVRITPLETGPDTVLILGNTKISEETIWEEGEILKTSMLSMAWANHDMKRIMERVYSKLYHTQSPYEAEIKNEQGQNTVFEKEISANITNTDENNEVAINNTKNANEVVTSSQQILPKTKSWFTLFLAIITVAALFFTFTPIQDHKFKNTEYIQNILADNGFSHIDIVMKDDTVIWQGIINDDTERAKLHALAQNMQFPVYLDVVVKTDLSNTFKQVFATQNLYPTVLTNRETIYLGYYAKDALVSQLAHNALRDLLPHYAELRDKIKEKTVYADELNSLIAQKQEHYGLEKLSPVFDNGKILFNAVYSMEDQKKIRELVHEIEEELGFFIKAEFAAITAGKPAHDIAPRSSRGVPAARKVSDEPLKTVHDFTVTSVNMGAIPFITLGNNEKIFKGGILPSGGTLVDITLNELTINQNGSLTIYPLRGNQ